MHLAMAGPLTLVREIKHVRAVELIRDPIIRAKILASIRLGVHARSACAAQGIPGGAFDSIVGRGRAESQQFHDGASDSLTFFGEFHDAIEQAIGESMIIQTQALTESFDGEPKERLKWMLRRFGPEFAEASKRDDELPTRSSEKEVRALLYAKLGIGVQAPAIDAYATEKETIKP